VKREITEERSSKIVVVSDHGFTFLAQKRFGNFKKFDFSGADHQGRCFWTEHEYQSDSEFLRHHVAQGDYKGKNVLIALKHTSLQNTPSREVHGGATPEEVFVPLLVISRIDDRITYNARLLTPEISVKKPIITILVEPKPPQSPTLLLKGKTIPLEKQDNRWCTTLQGFKAGDYQFKLDVFNQTFDIEVTITGGFKERDLL